MAKDKKRTALRAYYISRVRRFYLVDTKKHIIYTTEGGGLTHVESKQFLKLQSEYYFETKLNPQLKLF